MRDSRLPLCLSMLAAACHQAQDAAGPPESGEPLTEPDPEPDSEPPIPTTSGAADSSSSSTDDPSAGTTTGAATSTTTDATTSPPPLPSCGDGVLDPGEACDLGVGENSDAAGCTQACQLNECGDGLVWVGQEECDDGLENNSQTYGGCAEDCRKNAFCGDGELQPEHEECDPSAPPVEGVVPCGGACSYTARLAFVTAATFNGQLGGLAGADTHCALAAAAMGLDNAANYLAWLGDGATGPATRFKDGLAAKGYPYARRDGKKLAKDLADLFAHGPIVPLDITEQGTQLPAGQYAWTNLKAEGVPTSPTDHCQHWSSASYKDLGNFGQVSPADDSEMALFEWRIGAHWTRFDGVSCKFNNGNMHLYCFED